MRIIDLNQKISEARNDFAIFPHNLSVYFVFIVDGGEKKATVLSQECFNFSGLFCLFVRMEA